MTNKEAMVLRKGDRVRHQNGWMATVSAAPAQHAGPDVSVPIRADDPFNDGSYAAWSLEAASLGAFAREMRALKRHR